MSECGLKFLPYCKVFVFNEIINACFLLAGGFANVVPKHTCICLTGASLRVNKSAREQFELKKFSYILQMNEKINVYLLKFLFLNKPKSVSICFKNL